MSDGGKATVQAHAFPGARQNGAPPAWIAAAPGEVRPATFGRPARSSSPEASRPEPEAPPPPPPPVPAVAVPPRREPSAEAFARGAVELAAARARALSGAEEQLLDLGLAIASAIVEREIERDPSLHGVLARTALETLGNPAGAKLRASHEAYAAILDTFGAPAITADGVSVEVTLDPTLDGLGCIAENEHGRVDARIGERLRAVRRALDDERRRIEIEEAG